MNFSIELTVAVLFYMLALMAAPFCFPPRRSQYGLPESVGQLIAQYVWGMGFFLLAGLVYFEQIGQPWRAVELFIIAAAGGSVVVFRYTSEWIKKLVSEIKARRAEDRAKQLEVAE